MENQNTESSNQEINTEQTTSAEQQELLEKKEEVISWLKERFAKKKHGEYSRPGGVELHDLEQALMHNNAAIRAIHHMIRAGGEPDVITVEDGKVMLGDCCAEAQRGGLSHLQALNQAQGMGVRVMDEVTYKNLGKCSTVDQQQQTHLVSGEYYHDIDFGIRDANERKDMKGLIGEYGSTIMRKNNLDFEYPDVGWRAMLELELSPKKHQASEPVKETIFPVELFARPKILQFLKNIAPTKAMRREIKELLSHETNMELMKTLETGYEEMVETLQDFGYDQSVLSKVPDKQTVMKNIQNLSPKMLEKIKKFGKPTLLITPAEDYRAKLIALNDHKKLKFQKDDVYGTALNDPIWNTQSTQKMVVTIVDGQSAMPQPAQWPAHVENLMTVDLKMRWYEQEYAKENMEVMSSGEGAMLMMLSAKRKSPIDCVNIHTPSTITYYSRKALTKGEKVPYGYYDIHKPSFYFDWDSPENRYHTLRARPSVHVMEV